MCDISGECGEIGGNWVKLGEMCEMSEMSVKCVECGEIARA